jgi:hypothetical protein
MHSLSGGFRYGRHGQPPRAASCRGGIRCFQTHTLKRVDPNHLNSDHLFTHMYVIYTNYLLKFFAPYHCEVFVIFVLIHTSILSSGVSCIRPPVYRSFGILTTMPFAYSLPVLLPIGFPVINLLPDLPDYIISLLPVCTVAFLDHLCMTFCPWTQLPASSCGPLQINTSA